MEELAYFSADVVGTKPSQVAADFLSVCGKGKALRNEVQVAARHMSQRLSD